MSAAAASQFTAELERDYAHVRAFDAEFLFLYTDLRTFGHRAHDFPSRDAFLEALLAPLISRGATVLIPTFTYTAEGEFHVESTPSRLGAINKWVVGREGTKRSEHPLFSVTAAGPNADVVLDVGKSAFGGDSIFDRLNGRGAAFLHVGRPVAVGNTCVHYVEQLCGATYRYHKAFNTAVYRAGAFIGSDYTAFVRRRDVPGRDFDFVYGISERDLHEGLGVRETGSNAAYTNISCYSYDRSVRFLMNAFYRDPSIFIEAPFFQYD